ncbi:MAG TPA: type II secretion system protein GspG [Arcobacter sp.]|nr:type II secretion system protein GspG [Arcobacter sp.]HIP56116.1 type II secretion system protein GspG [Arcobacter sp.]
MINKKNKNAFTLLELMVVILILGLLASFVLPKLTGKSEEAKVKVVCIQMKSISQALKMYKVDNSNYPSTSEGLQLLSKKGYFEDDKIPKDSWKQKYIYTSDDNSFDIISFGANKKEGGSDDIYYSKCEE